MSNVNVSSQLVVPGDCRHLGVWPGAENTVDRIQVWAGLLFIAACLLLPSGSIYGVNVKLYLSLACLATVMLRVVVSLNIFISDLFLAKILVATVSISSVAGLIEHGSLQSINSHISAITATVLPCWIGLTIARGSVLNVRKLLYFLLFIALVHVCVKDSFVVMIMTHTITHKDYWTMQESIFGNKPISMVIDDFVRLHTVTDYVIPPMMLFSTWMYKKKEIGLLSFGAILLLFSVAIVAAYSRYLWLFFIVALLVGGFDIFKGMRGARKVGTLFLLPILAIIVSIISYWSLLYFFDLDAIDLVVSRFNSKNTSLSDSIRDDMYRALLAFFEDATVFGHGIGSYPKSLVRFPENPWNYELQWLAIAGQFGLSGIAVISAGIACFINKMLGLCRGDIRGKEWLLLFGMWLTVGLFNCFLISSSSGAIHLIYILLIKYVAETKACDEVPGSQSMQLAE